MNKNYCGARSCHGHGHYEICGENGIGEAYKPGSGPHQCGHCTAKDLKKENILLKKKLERLENDK